MLKKIFTTSLFTAVIITLFLLASCAVEEVLPGPEYVQKVLTTDEFQNFTDVSAVESAVVYEVMESIDQSGISLRGEAISTDIFSDAAAGRANNTLDLTVDSPSGGNAKVTGYINVTSSQTEMSLSGSITITFNSYVYNGKTINGTVTATIAGSGLSSPTKITMSQSVEEVGNITIDGVAFAWDFTTTLTQTMTQSGLTITYTLRGTVNGKDISHTISQTVTP